MNQISQTCIFIPCHSMEDFPTHYVGKDAENLLACWTAMWHPALISVTGKKPNWQSADNLEILTPQSLLVLPQVSQHVISPEFMATVEEADSILIADELDRAALIEQAIESSKATREAARNVHEDLAGDFLALGYGYLQIQIMTRQLRYSSNLNESEFLERLVQAAQTACSGNREQTEDALQRCFDLLLEEKNTYYPVEPELIDLVLTAPSTLGPSMTRQLTARHSWNLLITGSDLKKLAQSNPEALATARQKLEDQKISLVGGLESELPDPLISSESLIRQFRLGHQAAEQLLGTRPTVFSRRRFGLTPVLPGLLGELDYVGAIHATFEDGVYPRGSSANIRWTGDDGNSILAFGDLPVSADDPASMLGLGLKIGEQIDSAHVSTLVFAHWPGRTCDSFQDLLRIANYGSLLGNFVRIEDYFDSIYDPGYGDTFTPDEYKQPYFRQQVESGDPNPISSSVQYWTQFWQLAALRFSVAQLIQKNAMTGNVTSASNPSSETPGLADVMKQIRALEEQLDRFQTVDLRPVREAVIHAWSQATSTIEDTGAKNATMIINPFNHLLAQHFQSEKTSAVWMKSRGAIDFADSADSQTDWVVRIPPTGYLKLPTESAGRDPFRSEPSMLDGSTLRNEFFEIHIDENSGGVRAVQLYEGRRKVVGQKLSLRAPSESASRSPRLSASGYATMVMDELTSESSSRIRATIATRGRLLDKEQTVAEYEQRVTLTRGCPLAELQVLIDPKVRLSRSINHYFCNRWAWKDESSTIYANLLESRHQVCGDWFSATQFIEVHQPDHRVLILTGGLPFHRRVSRRMVDNILIAGNESARAFRFGIGVDLKYPLAHAAQWMAPPLTVPCSNSTEPESNWLYHFSSRNLVVTHWEPQWDPTGKFHGMLIRLRETEGRGGNLVVTCPTAVASAKRVSLSGQPLRDAELDSANPNQVKLEFAGFELFQISVTYQS